jgi:NAD+ kinase
MKNKKPKLAFLANAAIDLFKKWDDALKQRYGKHALDDAGILVPVGGDGSVFYALPRAKGRVVYGVSPDESNSYAWTANTHKIGDDQQQAIRDSNKFPLHPLEMRIRYQDGKEETIDVYSSANIIRDSAQAMMVNLTGTFNGLARKWDRVVGCGLLFSTAVGSTGQSWSYGGPILPLSQPAMIFNGMGLARPSGLKSIVSYDPDAIYEVECLSHGRRPLRIDHDSDTLRPDPANPIKTVTVRLKSTPTAILAVKPGSMHPFDKAMPA